MVTSDPVVLDCSGIITSTNFLITTITLCGSQPNLQRKAIARMLAEWEREHPGRNDSIFHALCNVSLSQLADPKAFDFLSLVRERILRDEAGGEAVLEDSLERATLFAD